MILAREIRDFERHKNLEKLIETESPLMVAFKEAFQITDSLKNKQSREQYLEHTKYYLKMYFDDIFYRSRYHEYIVDNLKISTEIVDDLRFSVSSEYEGGSSLGFKLSLGSYLAIQDISMRALSSQNFFNPLLGDKEYKMRWLGSRLKAPPKFFEPRQRYFDYSIKAGEVDPQIAEFYKRAGFPLENTSELPWLGSVLDRMPVDGDRLYLAAHIQFISLSFLFLHEECHYRQGHFQFLLEESSNYSNEELKSIMRCFEYQADKDACQGVIELAITRSMQSELPVYARVDFSWLLRFVLVSLGFTFILAEISRLKYGDNEYYPRPLTRLFGAFKGIQAMMAIKETYKEFRYGFFQRRMRETDFQEQCAMAFTGAIWDLTEVQMLISNSVGFDKHGFWPLSDAFPFMASSIIHTGETSDDRNDFARFNYQADARIAEMCSLEFDLSKNDAMQFRDFAKDQMNQLDDLIKKSDGFRPLTEKYRLWEIDDENTLKHSGKGGA